MPSTVRAGRAQSMSETVPSPSSSAPSTTPASVAELVWWVGGAGPGLGIVQPGDRGVAVRVAQRGEHGDQGGQCVGSRAAEHAGVQLGGQRLDADDDVDHPAEADGGCWTADGGVPGVADEDCVGPQQVGVLLDEGLEAAGALLLRALDDELEVDWQIGTQGPEGGQVHQDVALAVCGPAAVPAAVDLGQLERRCVPGVFVEWGLDVVVRVQQHCRCVWVPAGAGTHHGHAAVGGFHQAGVVEPDRREVVEHPLRGPLALLRRELSRVGDRAQRDELGELVASQGHQGVDPCRNVGAERHRVSYPATLSSSLRSSTKSSKSASSSGQ